MYFESLHCMHCLILIYNHVFYNPTDITSNLFPKHSSTSHIPKTSSSIPSSSFTLPFRLCQPGGLPQVFFFLTQRGRHYSSTIGRRKTFILIISPGWGLISILSGPCGPNLPQSS